MRQEAKLVSTILGFGCCSAAMCSGGSWKNHLSARCCCGVENLSALIVPERIRTHLLSGSWLVTAHTALLTHKIPTYCTHRHTPNSCTQKLFFPQLTMLSVFLPFSDPLRFQQLPLQAPWEGALRLQCGGVPSMPLVASGEAGLMHWRAV